jgi:hypothetical protein
MRSIPTARIVLDTRREKKNALYSIKLRITFQRLSKYYITGKYSSEADFARTYGAKPRDEFKTLRTYLQSFEARAQVAISSTMPFFSWQKFEAAFYKDDDAVLEGDLEEVYAAIIDGLIKEGRLGNADSFKRA